MELSSPVHDAVYRRLHARFGPQVERWWRALPAAVAELSDRWALAVSTPVDRGNTSLVLRCRRLADDSAAMLKLSPDTKLAAAEATSLRKWASSRRVPAIWADDAERGALLLEAIPRETPLSECTGFVPLAAVAELIGGLHRAGSPVVGGGIISLAKRIEFIFEHWGERHRGHPEVTDLVPLARLQRGYELARRLVVDSGAAVLLHGDLHPGNVLDGGESRGLVAIDPRPCVGEPAFDVVDWVFWSAEAARWESRSHELASMLDIEHARVWAWCSAFAAMLAASNLARDGSTDTVESLLALAA